MDPDREATTLEQGQPGEDTRDRPACGRHQFVDGGAPVDEFASQPAAASPMPAIAAATSVDTPGLTR